jgi:signal transduction histidine kinase
VLEFSSEGRVTYFNEAAAALGKSLGKEHPSAMLPPECAGIVVTCLSTGQNRLDVKTVQGGRTFSWSFFPIPSNQVVHCYVTETTEFQNLEAQLRHAQKLDSVGRLAGGIAHDLHNVLTVILGHTSLLRSEPTLSGPMRDSVQQVSRAAERASKLISHLLTFSRKNILPPRRLDLNELLTHMGNLLHRTLGEDITFQFSYAPDLASVHGDAALLEQVIMNLGVNARDAMTKGGLLLISTSCVEIDSDYVDRPDRRPGEPRCGQFVCVSVTDTGSGMDTATMSRLFEPYFTTKPSAQGAGLGLAK